MGRLERFRVTMYCVKKNSSSSVAKKLHNLRTKKLTRSISTNQIAEKLATDDELYFLTQYLVTMSPAW
jgi:hypothetical protein